MVLWSLKTTMVLWSLKTIKPLEMQIDWWIKFLEEATFYEALHDMLGISWFLDTMGDDYPNKCVQEACKRWDIAYEGLPIPPPPGIPVNVPAYSSMMFDMAYNSEKLYVLFQAAYKRCRELKNESE